MASASIHLHKSNQCRQIRSSKYSGESGNPDSTLPKSALACSDGDLTVGRSNIIYLVVGALVVVVAVMGYQLYQDRKKPEGMRIDVGPNGLSIEKK
jgi:hypothetical protein